MHFEIPYEKKHIGLDIPDKNIVSLNYKNDSEEEPTDEEKIISEAIKNPVSTDILSNLAYSKSSVCIIVSDITRPCPSYKFLEQIIKELKKVKVKDIKILFGLGIHRNHSDEEKIRLVGNYAAENARLIDFDAENVEFVGTTSFGTPVEVSKEVISSDFLIATGNIEYHYFAGYSGGAKAVMPGVCSKKTISANHSMMLENDSVAAKFISNPVRQDIEEAGRLVSIDFLFNVILNDSKKIISAVSGKNNEAFIKGIKIYDSLYEINVDEKADLVITSPGGYPKDINLYQAQKALDNIKGIVKDGGKIVFVAACSEGYGEKMFEEWMQEVNDYEKLSKKIKQNFVLGGHKAVVISRLLTKSDVFIYSDFKDFERTGLKRINNIQDFIDGLIRKEKSIKIAVVPNGRFVKSL
jgi:nickel-dependent lactate racemase